MMQGLCSKIKVATLRSDSLDEIADLATDLARKSMVYSAKELTHAICDLREHLCKLGVSDPNCQRDLFNRIAHHMPGRSEELRRCASQFDARELASRMALLGKNSDLDSRIDNLATAKLVRRELCLLGAKTPERQMQALMQMAERVAGEKAQEIQACARLIRRKDPGEIAELATHLARYGRAYSTKELTLFICELREHLCMLGAKDSRSQCNMLSRIPVQDSNQSDELRKCISLLAAPSLASRMARLGISSTIDSERDRFAAADLIRRELYLNGSKTPKQQEQTLMQLAESASGEEAQGLRACAQLIGRKDNGQVGNRTDRFA
jgi:hypothetical protein